MIIKKQQSKVRGQFAAQKWGLFVRNIHKLHPEVANLPSINGDKSAPSNADNPNTEAYWMKVVEELNIAGEIVKSVNENDSS